MPEGFLQAAASAARKAGEHILSNLGRLAPGDVGMKQASDFVTRVDRESEEIIIKEIRAAFPGHSFLAEESAHEERTRGGYRWIIDPLDGTTNFIHSYPAFAVSIALEHDGGIVAAVVLDPLRGELFRAARGGGAFLGEQRLTVSSRTEMSGCLVATGFPFKQKDMLPKYLELFSLVLHRVSDIRRAGAAALDLAHLSAGRCDGFFELGLSPWDIAAGSLLITEAGGVVTDFGGGGEYLATGNVIAGNPSVHPVLLGDAQAIFGSTVER